MVDFRRVNPEEPQEGTTHEAVTTAAKKPKRFQCMRCDTRFARLEHLQRHERIRERCVFYIAMTRLTVEKPWVD
ncbi:hypothetical protein ACJ72_08646, partial [Emergomyces africanus]